VTRSNAGMANRPRDVGLPSVSSLTGWLVDWLGGWLAGWLVVCLVGWLLWLLCYRGSSPPLSVANMKA
jgi:hypothetical protein